jgi:hypothetical protein
MEPYERDEGCVLVPAWASRFREWLRIVIGWLNIALWFLLLMLMIWSAQYWDFGTLETGLVMVACLVALSDVGLWAGLARSPNRHLIGRKWLMFAVSLVGFGSGVAPAVYLPIVTAFSSRREPAMQSILMGLALGGMILVVVGFLVGDTRQVARLWREYAARRMRPE